MLWASYRRSAGLAAVTHLAEALTTDVHVILPNQTALVGAHAAAAGALAVLLQDSIKAGCGRKADEPSQIRTPTRPTPHLGMLVPDGFERHRAHVSDKPRRAAHTASRQAKQRSTQCSLRWCCLKARPAGDAEQPAHDNPQPLV